MLLPGLAGRLDEITGVDTSCAQVIIAELGTDVSAQFPTPAHAAAWAKLVPIAHQSGAPRGPARRVKATAGYAARLGTAAMAAAKSKGTFLGERYQRIRRRRGKQKALFAIARTILEIAYRLIADATLRPSTTWAPSTATRSTRTNVPAARSGNWNDSTPARKSPAPRWPVNTSRSCSSRASPALEQRWVADVRLPNGPNFRPGWKKAHLEHVYSAVALNLVRLGA
ncbi:transposase [Nonomuraea sp. B19D2]|uniref:transposase n=1 Tax=Nonomuraea sp. B19D2 TaxID=3159561 RepID=UPI0032DB1A13